MNDEARLRKKLKPHGQEHLLTFWNSLNDSERAELTADIESVDFDGLKGVTKDCGGASDLSDPSAVDVPESLPATPVLEFQAVYDRARELGDQAIRRSRVAAMVVAGGQATRLGYDAPKGMFPIAPISGKSLFQLFAESILAINRRFGCRTPWYVMTSAANHDATTAFFENAGRFGLPREDVLFFRQGMMPVLDLKGRILLEKKHRLALAPNGHGGSLTALAESGMLEDMARRGIDYISYFQVDNPLTLPVDPLLIGLHALQRSEMSSLVIAKATDDERVGHFVTVNGQLRVIEYSDFPASLASLRNADGSRKFDLANIAVHVLDRAFVERIVGDRRAVSLPWHRSRKKADFVDLDTGRTVSPEEPNAIKSELFVFDALGFAQRPMLLQTSRAERFSPVKNAEGADSIATARRDMVRRAAAWLGAAGITVPKRSDGEPDCVVEISPLYALDADMLREREGGARRIERGAKVLIE